MEEANRFMGLWKKLSWSLAGAYWCLATAIFLAMNFYVWDVKVWRDGRGWGYAALFWSIAGVLFGALMFILRFFTEVAVSEKKAG